MIRQLPSLRQPFQCDPPALARTTAVLLFFALLGGCKPGGANQSNGNNANSFVLISKPSFVKSWDTQLFLHKGDSILNIYAVQNTIHVLTDQNFDYALSSDTGESLYMNQVGTPDVSLKGSPVRVTDGIVFATNHTLELYDLHGIFQKSIDVQYTMTSQITGHQSYVYVGVSEGGGRLIQVDVTQDVNPVRWSVMTNGNVDGAAACQDNVIYFGSESGAVQACLDDRSLYWPLLTDSKFQTDGKILSDIKIDQVNAEQRDCYFSSTDGKLYCIDGNTGKVKWRYFAGIGLNDSPAVTSTTVYQYVDGVGLVALNKTQPLALGDGEQIDENPIHTPRWTARGALRFLTEDDHYAYVLLADSRTVAALDKQTGKRAFTTRRRDLAFFAASPKDPTIYAVTKSGRVMAFKPVLEPGAYGELVLNAPPATDSLVAPR